MGRFSNNQGWRDYVPPAVVGGTSDPVRAHPETAPEARATKPRKYRNEKVEVDGRVFDSAKEADRYRALKLLLDGGAIRDLCCQPRYRLSTVNKHGVRVEVATFTPDFRYIDVQTGATVIEDVKSPITRKLSDYALRRTIFEAEHGLTVTEL